MSLKTIHRNVFYFFAACFVAAGAHHLYEYFVPELRPDYPPMRHVVFLCINLVLAILMVRRTKWFLPFLFLISAQQLYGHGANIIQSFYSSKAALYADWFVVLLVPVILFSYSYDVLSKDKES